MAEKKEEFCTVLVISAEAPEDAAAASRLRKRLEQFRLPSYIRNTLQEGKRTIRAFSEEGPDAAKAVEGSQWLAVVCSPRLKDSDAAMDLIRRFKKQKGQERILAVLLEGEPADSFPEELCFRERTVTGADGETRVITEEVEPLAADLREKDPGKQKKLLDDAVLRIAAPVFGLAFCGTAAAVSFVIACTSLYLSVKVSRQKKTIEAQQAELEEQYRIQQEKYRESMLTVAEELLEKDRRQDALYAVRSVLPEDPVQAAGACTPEVQRVLTSSLGVYDLTTLRKYKAEEYEQGERISEKELAKILYGDTFPLPKKEICSDDGKYTVREEGGRTNPEICFYEEGGTEAVRRLYDITTGLTCMKKLKDREGYLLISDAVAYLLDGGLEITAVISDMAISWRVIGFDTERNALIVFDDEEDIEEKFVTRYVPLLSAEELIQEADRLLEGYTPSEEVLTQYGIM